jgi:hypothetical protein
MSSGRTPEGEPGSHQLMRSQEAHQAVSSVIAQVYNTHYQVSIAALGQLDKPILLETGVADLPEGGRLVRAVDVLIIKIVDRSGHNAVSGALVRLLHECIGSSVLGGKYCMLAMNNEVHLEGEHPFPPPPPPTFPSPPPPLGDPRRPGWTR